MSLIGKTVSVLNGGFVRVIDIMGGDSSVVQAARISYGEGTKTAREDRALIRYLMRHRHTSPFEMAEIKLHVRVPMDAWRQWIRHRTANVNEYSTRYSVAIDECLRTSPEEWRSQGRANKQGSGEFLNHEVGRELTGMETSLYEESSRVYNKSLELGVAREQARKHLPLCTFTEAYWKIDLHNLFHFLSLRMDSHAQKEIRQYATAIGEEIVAEWVPVCWEAFLDYRLGACQFSRQEMRVLRGLLAGVKIPKEADILSKSEVREFREKLLSL